MGLQPNEELFKFLADTSCVDYFVAHNGHNFDRPFLLAKLHAYGFGTEKEFEEHPIWDAKRWIDSLLDIEHKGKSSVLNYCAADHGF